METSDSMVIAKEIHGWQSTAIESAVGLVDCGAQPRYEHELTT